MADLRESDIIFSSAAQSLKIALTELKRSNLTVKNRLHSIKRDADFVSAVAEAYALPLVANERCGSWYITPEQKVGSAYFKSTDGHFGQWSFSSRRLNVQILEIVGKHGGCVIVDSTRRGKSMPDALSKTVPIWCCVMNRLLFPEQEDAHCLRTPDDVISESEHAQIEARLPGFLTDVRDLGLDLEQMRRKMGERPLEVIWQRPGESLPETSFDIESMNLIVLCTASNQTSNETSATSDYVQGAADDSESWALGLDAAKFWRHSDWFLAETEDQLPELIRSIVAGDPSKPQRSPTMIVPTCNLWISNNASAEASFHDYDIVVSCNVRPNPDMQDNMRSRYLHLQCPSGKNGSRLLRSELHKIERLRVIINSDTKILVNCQTGRDLAVGVALAVLCQFCHDNGKLQGEIDPDEYTINKAFIKQRLSWIMVSMPDASPSRATLQSVNAYLMD